MPKPKLTFRGRDPKTGRYVSTPIQNATAPPANQPRRVTKGKPAAKPKKSDAPAQIISAPTPPPAAALQTTHIALVVDRSSSMHPLQRQVVNTFNQLAGTIAESSKGQRTTVSLVFFDNTVDVVYIAEDSDNLRPLSINNYIPRGMTALFDGVGKAVERLQALPDSADPNTSFLVMALTDGEENSSMNYNQNRIKQLLEQLDQDGRWTVTFQLPVGARSKFCDRFKISEHNVREWEQTDKGIQETTAASDASIRSFLGDRARGVKRADKFFTDLSKVTTSQVKAKLVNVTGQYTQYTVDKEEEIRDFVERKTRKPYVIGSAYYELTKPETVQPQKDVLIVERGKEKEAVYSGAAARDMLGLPQGVSAKLTPQNLSKWRPLIKSTSVNRKVVRGTIVLVDKSKVVPDTPTWDHTKV